MNRQPLFRGKRVDNDEWVYGDLIHRQVWTTHLTIIRVSDDGFDHYEEFEVKPETVGEFTNLTDKNGNKIFEGDIVAVKFENGEICCIGDVQFDCGVFGAEWTVHKKSKSAVGMWGQRHNLRRLDDDCIDKIEVIGNIYDKEVEK